MPSSIYPLRQLPAASSPELQFSILQLGSVGMNLGPHIDSREARHWGTGK